MDLQGAGLDHHPGVGMVLNILHHVGARSLHVGADSRHVGAVHCDSHHAEGVGDCGHMEAAGHSSHHHQEVGLKDSDWLK